MKLKKLMVEMGISINELSKRSGVNRITITSILEGKRKAQIATLSKICSALNCSLEDIED